MSKKEDLYHIPDNRELNSFLTRQRDKILVLLENRLQLSEADAQDVYQEAGIILYNNIRSGKLSQLTSSLATYFTSVCFNHARKHLSRQRPGLSYETVVEQNGYHAQQIERLLDMGNGITREQRTAMRSLVNQLPPLCGKILWAYYADSMRMEEIARLVGFNGADSVKSKKSQCMSKLKERFKRIKEMFYD